MVLLSELVKIKSGVNGYRLTEEEKENLYEIPDLEYDYNHMNSAKDTSEITYYQGIMRMQAVVISDKNKDKILNQSYGVLIADTTKIDSKYLCFVLNESQSIKRQISKFTQGSIAKRLAPNLLKDLKLTLPPLEKQRKIGQAYAAAIYNDFLQREKSIKLTKGVISALRRVDRN